jgi:hypothetical protein
LSYFGSVGPENTRKNNEGLKEDKQDAFVFEEEGIRNKIEKKEA